ncbi:hypothetical protein RRG08_016048 [Elysia crispata]|uniref:Uncharacterized protein n=1 Tax=Elysia crispata TaxID=231223 RepID=A0AAE1DK02_9GAST|nr:hypothetical protein RRG08_016048 [Elysia crispata]
MICSINRSSEQYCLNLCCLWSSQQASTREYLVAFCKLSDATKLTPVSSSKASNTRVGAQSAECSGATLSNVCKHKLVVGLVAVKPFLLLGPKKHLAWKDPELIVMFWTWGL